MVFRVYVEKKPGFDVAAQQLANELRTILGIEALKNVRLVNRYDVEGISEELFAQATPTVFSEPQVDNVYADLPDFGSDTVFAVEYLPGQFDQRADSASECIQLISQRRASDGSFRQGVCVGRRTVRSRCRGHQALRDQSGGSP